MCNSTFVATILLHTHHHSDPQTSNTPKILSKVLNASVSQGAETAAGRGGAAALRGVLPRPPAAGQRLLRKGEQAPVLAALFTSLSNFSFGTDERDVPARLW